MADDPQVPGHILEGPAGGLVDAAEELPAPEHQDLRQLVAFRGLGEHVQFVVLLVVGQGPIAHGLLQAGRRPHQEIPVRGQVGVPEQQVAAPGLALAQARTLVGIAP